MALWQYSFFVLPKVALNSRLFFAHGQDGVRLFDTEPFFKMAKLPAGIFSEVSAIWPLGKSWSENLTVYGDIESNCLQVFCEDGIVASVQLRIDFLTGFEEAVTKLIEFFNRQGLILIDQELQPIRLKLENVKYAIESSDQLAAYRKLSAQSKNGAADNYLMN